MVGAGVIGLSTAVCLAERRVRVEVRAELEPAQTTSAVASAMIGPAIAPADSRISRWEQASIAYFGGLADQEGSGVMMCRGRLTARQPVPAPPGDVEPCGAEELPSGFAVGYWATLPLVDMVRYLSYLAARLTTAGGRIALRRVPSLPELADEVGLIVNCAGLGARELAADDSVIPARGQHVVVENPGVQEFFMEAPFAEEWAAYWPYPGHVVLGGPRVPATHPRSPTSSSPNGSWPVASKWSPGCATHGCSPTKSGYARADRPRDWTPRGSAPRAACTATVTVDPG